MEIYALGWGKFVAYIRGLATRNGGGWAGMVVCDFLIKCLPPKIKRLYYFLRWLAVVGVVGAWVGGVGIRCVYVPLRGLGGQRFAGLAIGLGLVG